jgi:hypothetical protein
MKIVQRYIAEMDHKSGANCCTVQYVQAKRNTGGTVAVPNHAVRFSGGTESVISLIYRCIQVSSSSIKLVILANPIILK